MLNATTRIVDWPDIRVTELTGRLDGDSGAELVDANRLLIQAGLRELQLDCAQVTALTGMGAHSLLVLARLLLERGGKLTLNNLQGEPRRMFMTCGLDTFIACQLAESVFADQAIAA